jgi:hypothetical protein
MGSRHTLPRKPRARPLTGERPAMRVIAPASRCANASERSSFTLATYNLTRMGGLFGWRWSTALAVVRLKSAKRRVTPWKRGGISG